MEAPRQKPLDEVVSFVSAKKFTGARSGMYFATGTMGLGYYRDRPKMVSLCRGLGVHDGEGPVVLRLDELIAVHQGVGQATGADGSGGNSSRTSSARRRKHKAARRGRRRGALDATRNGGERSCRLPGAREKMAWKGFRKLGLWAIDTVNPNCWSAAKEYLRSTAADSVLVAETKLPAADCLTQAESGAKTGGWNASILPCAKGPGGGASAGVAVAVRGHIGMREGSTAGRGSGGHGSAVAAGRIHLRHVGGVCRGGRLGAVYLHDVIGGAAPEEP